MTHEHNNNNLTQPKVGFDTLCNSPSQGLVISSKMVNQVEVHKHILTNILNLIPIDIRCETN